MKKWRSLLLPLYLMSNSACPKPPRAKKLNSTLSPKILMIGRVIFGNFVNPDTRSARKEASMRQASAAALERRNQAIANRAKNNEYDISRRIESEVTARMQRLAAGKRDTKKGNYK
mmetsp:Transcript_5422/g.13632  ORF Transcript_5422/g.13632 Transcript_5422/m.13632 type:complete len:116 (-) Transcript_5422:2550-2897(-)